MTASDVREGIRLLLKRFDRIGFGRRGVLDAEEQVVAWHAALPPDDRELAEREVESLLLQRHAAAAAEPLQYTRGEDVQALCVHLLVRWQRPGLRARLAGLQDAGEFLDVDGRLAPALGDALQEARDLLHD